MKKSIRKRILAGVLSMVMGMSLIACGGDENQSSGGNTSGSGSGENNTVQEYVYVPSYTAMEASEENSWRGNQFFYGDKLYYIENSYDAENAVTISKLCYIDVSNPSESVEIALPEIEVEEGFQSYLNNMLLDDAGNYYLLYDVSKIYVEGEEYDDKSNTSYMIKYDADMNQVYNVDLKDMYKDEDNRYIQQMIVNKEGKIFASSGTLVYVMDADGSFLKPISLSSEWVQNLFSTSDGRVFITQYSMNSNGMELVELNTETGSTGNTYKNLPDNNIKNIKGGAEGKLIICGSAGMYEYDLATQESNTLLKWIDCNMVGDYVDDFSMLSDEKILIYYNDWSTNADEMITMTKTDASKVPVKESIVLATLYEGGQGLERAVVEFNKKSDKYKITIKPYIANDVEWTENTYSDAVTLMNSDLTGSNPPDIIDLSYAENNYLATKGVLEDLTPYIEQSSVMNKEDFVPSVLDAYTVNGKLVTIPKTFQVLTLMGKSSIVGEEPGWTIADMIALVDKYPDAELLNYVTNLDALRICLSYSNDSFIDYETGICHFDSEEFIEVLEFANRFGSTYDYDEEMSFPKKIQANKILLNAVNVSDMNEFKMYTQMFEEEATNIGYPTKDGTPGVILTGSDMYGIMSKSTHKEGAWEFIESYISDEDDTFSWGLPTKNDALEELFTESMKKEYMKDENGEIMKDENGNPIETPKTSWGYDDWEADIYAATQEEVDQVKEMIRIARPMGMNDEKVFEMINEEAQGYFSGQKSAKDVATVIQSRVSIYVSENS